MTWFKKNAAMLTAMIITAAFLVANFILLTKDFYWLFMLPLAGLVLLLFMLKLEIGLLVIALMTPFAIDFALLPGMELSMPVEPMMILFSVMFIFRVLVNRWYTKRDSASSVTQERIYDPRLLRHPVTIAILAMLVWMVVSSMTSQMPAVSFKYFAARLWFVIPFFFASAQLFRNRERMRQMVWCYALSLVVVILISTAKTFGNFHDLQTLHRVMRPFYNDHTAYGCVIALFVPITFHLVFSQQGKRWLKPLMVCCFAAMLAGFFFSYSRAAWISVIGAVGVYFAIRMGMKVKWMLLFFGLGVTLFFFYQSDVLYKLGKNKQDSSYDLSGQVKSISNISTDASNLERLNRWASAMRMFKERPIMGCGPGTYQFLYASYQRSYQLSVISTNAGNLGNAHSEYIGPLTEQGIPGAACILAIFLITFATGVRVYRTAADPAVARLALAFTLSLLTYYIHGIFNNFLDTDKLSVPFWAFTAAVVALDVFSEKKTEPVDNEVVEKPGRKRSVCTPFFFVILLIFGGRAYSQVVAYPATPTVADMVIDEAMRYIGTPYRWGGKTPKGFDCAGFTRFVYSKFGVSLPPSAGPQYKIGPKITTKNLRKGDLVFWGGRGKHRGIGHVGIVTSVDNGEFEFIHASSTGVRITSSKEPYYKKRYVGACRVIDKIPSNLPLSSTDVEDSPSKVEKVYYYYPVVPERLIVDGPEAWKNNPYFQPFPASKADSILTIAMVGDMMLGTTYPKPKLPKNDGLNLFDDVQELLIDADIAVGNLEGTICEGGKCTKEEGQYGYAFRMPPSYAMLFKDAGFDFLSLANNHINDFGSEGTLQTMAMLDSVNILYAGVKGKCRTATLSRGGVTYGFCAFGHNSYTYRLQDEAQVKKILASLRETCDILIVSFHGGAEGNDKAHLPEGSEIYIGEHRGNLRRFAHLCIDEGADIVFGHGPHVCRALELYKGRLIAYSLGNFCTASGIAVTGIAGYAPVLVARIDRNGQLISGRIHSFIQPYGGGPRLDVENKVSKFMRSLTLSDIKKPHLIIEDDGSFVPK